MSLTCSRIPVHDYVASLADEVKGLELREKVPDIGRKIFSDKFLKVLQLGEVSFLIRIYFLFSMRCSTSLCKRTRKNLR